MKKCPLCDLNYIKDDEEMCDVCSSQKIILHHDFDSNLTEEDILSKASPLTKDLYFTMKEKVFELDKGLTIHPNISNYISIKGRSGKNLCAFWFANSAFLKITLHIRENNLVDTKGLTYKTSYDFAKYAINVCSNDEIDYAISLIKQVYDKQ